MRIAFITWEYPPLIVGGLGTYSHYITVWMARLGHEVEVYAPSPPGLKIEVERFENLDVNWVEVPDLSPSLRYVVNEEVRAWGEGVRYFSNIVTFNTATASLLVSRLLRREFDVVAFNDWLCSIAGVSLARLGGASAVYHVHSTEWGRALGRGSRTVSEIERLGAEYASKIITVSNAMKEDLQAHTWPAHKIAVVWNGVDPDIYDPSTVNQHDRESLRSRYGIRPEEQMILFVGRLVAVKGARELVEAMPHVLREFPKAKLVILGKGDLEAELQGLIRDLGLGGKVILRAEFVSERERILHYAASDVCVFPSIYEPFGIVSLEAMAMERPVVVGARGVVGFREQVIPSGEEQCGMHIDGSNPLDIAWGLKEVLRDPERARRMGRNGRKRVLAEFTWKRAAEKTLEIYSSLLQVQRA
ncbi:MAG: glycosyltransferase family 4 protein [Nitrososphaerota archaeon]|nr:glycosyltransferase family 4 protein [Candidatus Calditenuaceae archaeon]MDW8073289.1 glycosyltransferase family 4 protein [Nitrososphaerota archaeon]